MIIFYIYYFVPCRFFYLYCILGCFVTIFCWLVNVYCIIFVSLCCFDHVLWEKTLTINWFIVWLFYCPTCFILVKSRLVNSNICNETVVNCTIWLRINMIFYFLSMDQIVFVVLSCSYIMKICHAILQNRTNGGIFWYLYQNKIKCYWGQHFSFAIAICNGFKAAS